MMTKYDITDLDRSSRRGKFLQGIKEKELKISFSIAVLHMQLSFFNSKEKRICN